MRLILAAMIASVLSILAFKYADHSIGYSLFLEEASETEGATPVS